MRSIFVEISYKKTKKARNQVPKQDTQEELTESDGGSGRQQAAERLKDYDRANAKELQGLRSSGSEENT